MAQDNRTRAWPILVACMATGLLAAGSRYAFGALVPAIEAGTGWDRAVLSGAASLNVLAFGIGQVPTGFLADRLGPRRVMTVGLTLMAVSVFGLSQASALWQVYLFYGIVGGLGFAASSIVPASVLLLGWFPARPALAVGLSTAALPAGQAVFVPLAAGLVSLLGWQLTYVVIGVVVALIGIPVAWLVTRDPPRLHAGNRPSTFQHGRRQGWGLVVTIAIGFFACGFTDQLIAVHLVPFASGLGVALLVAAGAQSIGTILGIGGSIASGRLADGWSPRGVLVLMYLIRAVTFVVLLAFAATGNVVLLYAFAVLFGPTAIANAAPAGRLLRERYGHASVGTFLGMAQLLHQIGAAIGIGLGGLSFTLTGSYSPIFTAAGIVAFVASMASLALPHRRAPRPTHAAPLGT